MNDLLTRSFTSYMDLKRAALKDLDSKPEMEMVDLDTDENLGQFFKEVGAVKTDMETCLLPTSVRRISEVTVTKIEDLHRLFDKMSKRNGGRILEGEDYALIYNEASNTTTAGLSIGCKSSDFTKEEKAIGSSPKSKENLCVAETSVEEGDLMTVEEKDAFNSLAGTEVQVGEITIRMEEFKGSVSDNKLFRESPISDSSKVVKNRIIEIKLTTADLKQGRLVNEVELKKYVTRGRLFKKGLRGVREEDVEVVLDKVIGIYKKRMFSRSTTNNIWLRDFS
eukprot:Gb_36019 [translate_table: standard]